MKRCIKYSLLMSNILTFLSISLCDVSLALAQAAPGAVKKPSLAEMFSNLLPLIIMVFFVFYFLVTRPQQQKIRQQEALMNALKKGDLVSTSSGILGRVAGIESDHILVEVASGVKVKFEKSAITQRIEKTEQSKSGA